MATQINNFLLYSWGFCTIFILLISPTLSSRVHPKKHVALFVFGDSLFDPGNNNYLHTNSTLTKNVSVTPPWPYGETFFKLPTGRFSDGRLVPDFIAEFFNLPIWKAYLQPVAHKLTDGANFASAGAGVINGTHSGTIGLKLQLSYFKRNDYFNYYTTYPNASTSSVKQVVRTVTRTLTEILEEIYNIGGRKIAFQNVGALGCVPSNIESSVDGKTCLEPLSAMGRMHNQVLSNSLKSLEKRLPGFKYSIFDYYNSILNRVLHPSKYGFVNGTGSCIHGVKGGKTIVCEDPSKYVWFDGFHTTEACNWQLAKLMWMGKQDVVSPYNIKQLYQL